MNRLRLILLMCLCIFVALLSIGYITVGMDDEPTSELTSATDTVADTVPVTIPSGDDVAATTAVTTASTEPAEKTTVEKTTAPKKEEVTVSGYEYAYAGFNPSVAAVSEENWNLLLVNRDYILPDDFTVKTSPVKGGSQSLDYRVVPYYNRMVEDAEAAGVSLIPVSGYRSVSRQRTNFERKIKYYMDLGYSKVEATRLASQIVLMPATSEHNAGLAMDFGTNGNYTLDENFANTEAFRWLSENAADYGFILRYPKEAQNITNITYEPWHWRYVGTKAAKEIKASGVTLEEYLGMK